MLRNLYVYHTCEVRQRPGTEGLCTTDDFGVGRPMKRVDVDLTASNK